MPSFTPISPAALAELLAERACARPDRVAMAISAADAADPMDLANRVVEALRTAGRPAHAVSLHDFVRPASLRLEHGRTDEQSYRSSWFDYDALDREVVSSLKKRQRFLPRLWDETTDRSARVHRIDAADDHVVVVAGPMLLGRTLEFDMTVELRMSRGALERRTLSDDRWTIAPLLAHDAEVSSEADIVVRFEHPARPAVRDG
ncbi:nucleoside/nucleotide kinase family protein [Rhodococcus artemisiae]|uniref:Uridine kinase n=1 Tax=Rhodococcus artemisiae TaxID=714159 RepID=A0ABU7L4M9_9NOCA|nr:uridine kinase [Rhodococcus artemisiae]MEE2056249.1 uridine kinase [Rhodococcus artemisiae]